MKRRALLLAGGLATVADAMAQQAPAGAPRAKRTGPPDVQPVTLGGVRYEALHWGQARPGAKRRFHHGHRHGQRA